LIFFVAFLHQGKKVKYSCSAHLRFKYLILLIIKNLKLANTLNFSPVIAGSMKWGKWGAHFSTADYLKMIEKCLDTGVTTFDHADIYGNYTTEAEFGLALKEMPSFRKQMQLISKCGICMVTPNRPGHQIKHYNTSKEHIIESAERSLKNLQTDFLDLLLIHRPDSLMNPQEIAGAFTHLKNAGKVLHFGVSNFNASQTALLHSCFPVEVNQVEISILHTEALYNGVLDQCIREKIQPQSWSPLGGGILNGVADDERSRRIMAVAEILGERYAAGFDQILLAWLMKHPAGIIPVLGTTKAERIKDAHLSRSIDLTREEWYMLLRAATGHEVP
jgi:predicted oxidoreductase